MSDYKIEITEYDDKWTFDIENVNTGECFWNGESDSLEDCLDDIKEGIILEQQTRVTNDTEERIENIEQRLSLLEHRLIAVESRSTGLPCITIDPAHPYPGPVLTSTEKHVATLDCSK